ncbi:hypothetical protein ACFV6G_41005 [Streptomyces lavendulae]
MPVLIDAIPDYIAEVAAAFTFAAAAWFRSKIRDRNDSDDHPDNGASS